MSRRWWQAAFVGVGAVLLAVNGVGLLAPLRSPHLRAELTPFPENLTLSAGEAAKQAPRRPAETDTQYIGRLTDVVHRGMGHFWPDTAPERFNIHLPVEENYLLFLGGLVRPDIYKRYQLLDPHRALARGVGRCSQFALVLDGLLEKNGVRARVVGLSGHVVVEAYTGTGDRLVADTDYGVVMPYSIATLEATPTLAEPYYSTLRFRHRVGTVPAPELARMYGPEGKFVSEGAIDYPGNATLLRVEQASYVAKWLIPVMLIAAAAAPALRRRSLYARFGKRSLDVLAAAGVLIVLSPIMLLTAALIRVALGSPILFRQRRPGRSGRPFVLYKFRTMRDARAPDGHEPPDEERLTALGRWLRSTSLDELPELVNVLKGDMSLVGPRPLLMEYLPLYTAEQARRHEVRPGLTGWAQVNGRNAVSWPDKFRLDVWYVDHASLALDLRILAMTVRQVARREGITQTGHMTAERFTGTSS
jgi:sugar transferase EpsL